MRDFQLQGVRKLSGPAPFAAPGQVDLAERGHRGGVPAEFRRRGRGPQRTHRLHERPDLRRQRSAQRAPVKRLAIKDRLGDNVRQQGIRVRVAMRP